MQNHSTLFKGESKIYHLSLRKRTFFYFQLNLEKSHNKLRVFGGHLRVPFLGLTDLRSNRVKEDIFLIFVNRAQLLFLDHLQQELLLNGGNRLQHHCILLQDSCLLLQFALFLLQSTIGNDVLVNFNSAFFQIITN